MSIKSHIQKFSVEEIEIVTQQLIPLVNHFRSLQDTTGRVVGDINVAKELLKTMRPLVQTICFELNMTRLAKAFEADIKQWQAQGLNNVPDFTQSQTAYEPPQNGCQTFFIGAFFAPNGPVPRGYFLECFLARREESHECRAVSHQFPHPKNTCQSCHLLFASSGLSIGNCIVFFPENISTKKKVKSQNFALFFFNKFQQIYLSQTLPTVQHLLENKCWVSAKLSAEEFYHARCLWGYLHDYFHHCGPRPINSNLQVKLNWFAGLLEEIKVDCLTAITAYTDNIPFGREIFEFILFERIFRYPSQPDATTNFDSGTGVFLFEWLFVRGGINKKANGYLQINTDICIIAMETLVNQIEELEKELDDIKYLSQTKAFVRNLLPEGNFNQRFSLPEGFLQSVKITPH